MTQPPRLPYPDLAPVLTELVASLRRLLGDDFVGAYLQGSLAIGDFDVHRSRHPGTARLPVPSRQTADAGGVPREFVLPPWQAIYVNDAERDHTFAHAEAVHGIIRRWYRRCRYQLIDVPKVSVAARCAYVLRAPAERDA